MSKMFICLGYQGCKSYNLNPMTKKLSNLEIIKRAFEIGYCSIVDYFNKLEGVEHKDIIFLGFNDAAQIMYFYGNEKFHWISYTNINLQGRITSFKYAGQLAGNQISEGQRFRVKEGGEIGTIEKGTCGKCQAESWFFGDYLTPIHMKKPVKLEELEPVFDI